MVNVGDMTGGEWIRFCANLFLKTQHYFGRQKMYILYRVL